MFLGYNTNGFAHHRIEDALEILGGLGYRGVALTVDHGVLNPFDPGFECSKESIRSRLQRFGLTGVLETGARFLLDPWRKHQPTLLSPDEPQRLVRQSFLQRCVDLTADLKWQTVSLWSGTPFEAEAESTLWRRLTRECQNLADYAAARDVRLAFEPEPGMFIDTMPKFYELRARVDRPNFGLTLDVGHLQCQGELPVGEAILASKGSLLNVHLEDMKQGVHDHLRFGEGEIDFAEVFAALHQIGYDAGVYVELSRHSYDAVATARAAHAFLRNFA